MPGRIRIERGYRDAWGDQQVVALHELSHMRAQRDAAHRQAHDVLRGNRLAQRCLGREVGVGDRLLRWGQGVPDRRRTDEPKAGGNIQRVLEPWIDRLDMGTQRRQDLGGLGAGGRDVGVDVAGVSQRRRPGNAHTADAVVQADRVVGGVVGQGRPVAGIRLFQYVGHQCGIGHAHGMRAEMCHCPERR